MSGNPLDQAESWMRQGREVAIITLINAGATSAPQMGSQWAIDEGGRIAGGNGPPALMNIIMMRAADVINSGEPCLMELPEQYSIYVERVG